MLFACIYVVNNLFTYSNVNILTYNIIIIHIIFFHRYNNMPGKTMKTTIMKMWISQKRITIMYTVFWIIIKQLRTGPFIYRRRCYYIKCKYLKNQLHYSKILDTYLLFILLSLLATRKHKQLIIFNNCIMKHILKFFCFFCFSAITFRRYDFCWTKCIIYL